MWLVVLTCRVKIKTTTFYLTAYLGSKRKEYKFDEDCYFYNSHIIFIAYLILIEYRHSKTLKLRFKELLTFFL